jgi:hypothetical protein
VRSCGRPMLASAARMIPRDVRGPPSFMRASSVIRSRRENVPPAASNSPQFEDSICTKAPNRSIAGRYSVTFGDVSSEVFEAKGFSFYAGQLKCQGGRLHQIKAGHQISA